MPGRGDGDARGSSVEVEWQRFAFGVPGVRGPTQEGSPATGAMSRRPAEAFIHPFIHSFGHSFIHPFIHSGTQQTCALLCAFSELEIRGDETGSRADRQTNGQVSVLELQPGLLEETIVLLPHLTKLACFCTIFFLHVVFISFGLSSAEAKVSIITFCRV